MSSSDLTDQEFLDVARSHSDPPEMGFTQEILSEDKPFSISWQKALPDGSVIRAYGEGVTRREAVADAEANQAGVPSKADVDEAAGEYV